MQLFISEEFLQYLWQYRLYDKDNLLTQNGQKVTVISPGSKNNDAGPDFFNAKIKIGETTWVGNVEVHIHSSDWNKHGHQTDDAYNNVVLQVVENNDAEIKRPKNDEIIPTAVLKYDKKLRQKYDELLRNNTTWIPCEPHINKVNEMTVSFWLNKLLVERLEQKAGRIKQRLSQNKNNWEEAFYQQLARNFGFRVNAEPFELLAKSLPLLVLAKHKNNLTQVEALLFGQAGFLNDTGTEKNRDDDYFSTLKKEYEFLQHKFKLKPLESHLWKFLRLRPSNFPTIRIAQFAQLIHQSSGLFSKIVEAGSIDKIRSFFSVETSEYWKTRYTFGKISKQRPKRLGENAFQTIIINTVVPFIFVYAEERGTQSMKDKALEYLETLKPENNSVVKRFKELGIEAGNAFESQALLQLKKQYCTNGRCLQCQIGDELIRKG